MSANTPQEDPLLSAYREATEIYLRAVDMAPGIRARFVELVCAGRDLVHYTVKALIGDTETNGAGPDDSRQRQVDARIAAVLHRFVQSTAHAPHNDVTPHVPPAGDPERERTLLELIKLDQKARAAAGEHKAVESYLRDWPELRSTPVLIAELLCCEVLARAVYAAPATDAELELRFPSLARSVDLDLVSKRAAAIQRGFTLGSLMSEDVLPARFTNVRKIGQGGMGIVYAARDEHRGIDVAVKTLPTMEPRALLRLKREFRTLAELAHPNLVSLHELISDGTQCFFTMELIHGIDFVSFVRRRDPSLRADVLRSALRQLAEAVMALHAAGVLHRDLKPSNVLIEHEGRVVVLDFGLAKEMSVTRRQPEWLEPKGPHAPREATAEAVTGITWTQGEYLIGSLAYMSPEQAAGDALDAASDWYSVGVMLYESLTGKVPFSAAPSLLVAKQDDEPAPPSTLAEAVPPDLEDICMALLNRRPEARANGSDLLRQLGGTGVPSARQMPAIRSLPFVGRAAHLATLTGAYRALQHGRAVTVHIRGRSGAGKTALAQRFVAGLPHDAVVLQGRCYEQESVPYKALDSVVDQLCRYLTHLPNDVLTPLIPPDVPALARIFPVLERINVRGAADEWHDIPDAREMRRNAFRALGELLRRLCARAPLVLMIDDLQWGDVDSAALLVSLIDAPQPPPFLFIAAYRSEHADSNPCLVALNAARGRQAPVEIDVEPLTFADSVQLATLLLHDAGPDSATAIHIARESGGNPYFVYELAYRVDSGKPAHTGNDHALDLDEALWESVQLLSGPARQLLELVAIAGKPVSLRCAAEAADLGPDVAAAVTKLRLARLLRSTGPGLDNQLETYHDRIRESVAKHLPADVRIEHHRRLALTLEQAGNRDFEEIASHFHRAGMFNQAARHYSMAADKAAVTLAFERSAELYGVALELGAHSGDGARTLRRKRADALANAGRGYEAGQEYQRATAGAPLRERIELQRNAGYQYCVSGHIDEGREAFATVLAHFGARLPRTRRQALISLLWRRLRLRLRGMAFRERFEHEVRREDLDRVDIFWSVASGMTIADPIRGADFQTLDLILALEAGEPYRIARALSWEAAHLSMGGIRSRRRAQAQLAAAEQLARRIDRPHATGMTLMARGVSAYFYGDFTECQRCAESAIGIFRERCTGVSWELETCNAFAFWPLYFRGEYAELTRRFAALIAEVRARGARLAEADLTTFGGPFVWLAADDPDGAAEAVRGVMGEWSKQDFQVQHFTMLTAEAQIALYRGEPRAAWERVIGQWAGLRDAMLLQVEIVRIYMLHLRARCALAAAGSAPDRDILLRSAARDARRLEHERPAYAKALARTIRAALLCQRGNRDAAAATLERAAADLTFLGWGGLGTGARREYGRLVGGIAGERIVNEVDAYLVAQQVARPDRLCVLQAPGFT